MYFQLMNNKHSVDFSEIPSHTSILDLSYCTLIENLPTQNTLEGIASLPPSVKCLRPGNALIASSPIDRVIQILKNLPETIIAIDFSRCFYYSERTTEELIQIIKAIPKQVKAVNFSHNVLCLRPLEERLSIIRAFSLTLAAIDLRANDLMDLQRRFLQNIDPSVLQMDNLIFNDTDAHEKMISEIRIMELVAKNAGAYAETIVELEAKSNKSAQEELKLQLLLDPSTRHEASMILELFTKSNRTRQENRQLQLLLNPFSRKNTLNIMRLEETLLKTSLTEKEEKELSIYYLEQITKQDLHQHCMLTDMMRNDCFFPFFSPGSPFKRLDILLKTINTVIHSSSDALLAHYFLIHHISKKQQTTLSMQAYSLDIKQLLGLSLKKYFASPDTPEFNQANLEKLVSEIKDALSSRTLSLSNKEAMLDLEHSIHLFPSYTPLNQA